MTSAYGDHWWHRSLLAFVRQDQGRYDEAGTLGEHVLAQQADSGHAVHALTHVYYETGAHSRGLSWLDAWLTTCGRSANHRAHFSWHAALHELSLADLAGVRSRYHAQLAPPRVSAVRCLVDSASLLWRCRLADMWPGRLPVADVLEHAGPALLSRPETPFTGLHAAFALAAAHGGPGLARLRDRLSRDAGAVQRDVLVPLCDALMAMLDQQWKLAATLLRPLRVPLVGIGGSAAQREIVEETLLFCLVPAPASRADTGQAVWQLGHQNRLRASMTAAATGVPQTRHGRPVRR
ncbi:MAG: hypothetical protein ACRDWY_16390 [Actinomycetes bacterium]